MKQPRQAEVRLWPEFLLFRKPPRLHFLPRREPPVLRVLLGLNPPDLPFQISHRLVLFQQLLFDLLLPLIEFTCGEIQKRKRRGQLSLNRRCTGGQRAEKRAERLDSTGLHRTRGSQPCRGD